MGEFGFDLKKVEMTYMHNGCVMMWQSYLKSEDLSVQTQIEVIRRVGKFESKFRPLFLPYDTTTPYNGITTVNGKFKSFNKYVLTSVEEDEDGMSSSFDVGKVFLDAYPDKFVAKTEFNFSFVNSDFDFEKAVKLMDYMHEFCFDVNLWGKSSFEDSFGYVLSQQPLMIELSKMEHIRGVVDGGGNRTPRRDFRKRLENKV